MARPRTAATTTKKDEGRIKSKLRILENIERKIEEDIEEFNSKKKVGKQIKGIHITKQQVLQWSQSDSLQEVQAVSSTV